MKSLVDLSHTVMMATAIIKVSPVKVVTALLADLEELEKECKLSLVPRTWRLVAKPEEPFHSQSQKDHTSILRP